MEIIFYTVLLTIGIPAIIMWWMLSRDGKEIAIVSKQDSNVLVLTKDITNNPINP